MPALTPMKASEVLRRYAAGERDFRRTNLRGQSFKGQDLSGADFSEADIRGTNFSNAMLEGANFTSAKAGLQKRWILGLASIALISAATAGCTSAVVSTFAAFWSNYTKTIEQNTLFCGLAVLAIFMVLMLVFVQKGSVIVPQIKAWIWTLTITLIGILTGAGSWALAGKQPVAWAVTVTWAGGLVVLITLALTVILGLAVGLEWSKSKVIALVQCLIWAVVLAEVFAGARAGVAFAIGSGSEVGRGAGAGALVVGLLAGFIAWRTLSGGEDFSLLRKFAVGFAAMGGTTFQGADLTDTCLAGAMLRGVNLCEAKFVRNDFSNVAELDRARLGNSILANAAVRQLLVSRDGHDNPKDYIKANLRAANLNGVDLKGANLTGADISNATLHYADLQGANLREVLAIGADFTHAYLTGACLEAWNIDHTTKLEAVDCQYIFRLEQPNEFGSRERLPHNSDKLFQPGDFENYFKEVLDTVQLLIRKGATPQDFRAAFEALMKNHNVAANDIQGWQRKGDDLLLTMQVPIGTDKGSIERDFDQMIEARLEAAKNAGRLEGEYRRADSLEKLSLALVNSLSDLVPTTISATAMNDSNNPNISAPAGSFINTGNLQATGSTINLGSISGSVTNTIAQLQQSTDPEAAQLAAWLKELQGAIEAEPSLKPEDKAEALEQVGTLAKAGENPQDGALKKLSNTAVKILKGTIATLPDTAKLADACSKLLPLIRGVLGI